MSDDLEFQADPQEEKPKRAPAPPGPDRPLPGPRRLGVLDLMLIIAAIAVLARLAMMAGPVAALIMAFIVVVAIITGAIVLAVRGQSIEREAMLWVVASAAEKGVPLGPGIEACGDLCGGAYRRKAMALSQWLEHGLPLAEALVRVRDVFPTSGLVFTRMGWDRVHLGQALRDLSRVRAEWQPFRNAMSVRLAYLVWTLISMQLIIGFFMYWIMPKIDSIFMDFGIELPAITRMVIEGSHYITYEPALTFLVAMEMLVLPFLPLVFFDPLHWNIPLIDWFLIRRHGALVLRVLAGEVAMERPMTTAFERLSNIYPGRLVRRRLKRVALRVERGQSWHDALAAVGLIRRVDAAVLDAAQRVGNLSWALRDRAEGLDRRFGLRLMAWTQALFPLAILMVGSVVFVFAVAYFLPLVKLIQELA